nr:MULTISPECIES: SDR family oxidoreductase [unclassified Arthrobacter]
MPETEATVLPAVPGRFEGRTIIVTGAGSGIGRATAARISREGGRVIAVDIAEGRIKELADELGESIVPVAADLTDLSAVERIIAAAGTSIDGLANVAGINDDFSPLHEVSDAMWQKIFAVNVDGLVRLTRAVLPTMLEAGKGSIVNITSEAGLRGSASGVAYTASKHAVVGITRSTAFMYAREGIRVNAVAPGGVATGIPMGGKVSEYGEARLSPARVNIPGLASAEDLAASITFLLSDDGVNINGAILPSDGGWSAV